MDIRKQGNRLPFEQTPKHWKSCARIAGEAAEIWVKNNIKCPYCSGHLTDYTANHPVKDFECQDCGETFQLKASKKFNPNSDNRITGSSFKKWKKAIEKGDQPNILIMKYEMIQNNLAELDSHAYNPFLEENTTVRLTGSRIFKQHGYVLSVYFVNKNILSKDNLIKRDALDDNCRRSGWTGSYIALSNDDIQPIYPVSALLSGLDT